MNDIGSRRSICVILSILQAHYMLGNALLVNKSYQPAFATFVNALLNHCKSRTTTDISIIVEILKKICLTFMRLDKKSSK